MEHRSVKTLIGDRYIIDSVDHWTVGLGVVTTRRPTARTTAKIKLTLRPVKTAEQKTIRPIQQYGDWYTGSGR